MDLGLGNLSDLKAHLLNQALRSEITYDDAIAALGRGVAARFESFCSRRFGRRVADTYEGDAECKHVVLPRYPLEAVTKIELRETLKIGWVDQGAVDEIVENVMEQSGLVDFGGWLDEWPTRLRVTYTGGYWYPTRGTATVKRGSVALEVGTESLAVEFLGAFAAAPGLMASILAPDGGAVISANPSAVTAGGFTAIFGAPIPSAGYTLSWVAAATSYETPDETELVRGTVDLDVGAESLAVAFASAFATAPVGLVCNIIAPSGGVVISSTPSAVTTAGFTALFGAPIPAAGYKLAWFAPVEDDTEAEIMPAGATPLPADLKHAWLQQCQLVWSAMDALGVGLGSIEARNAAVKALGELKLSPEVESTLRSYIRYALA